MNTKAPAPTSAKRSTFKRRVLWNIGLIILIPLALGAAWFIAVWGNIDFGSQELVATMPCKDSGYKLIVYKSSKGNGHLDFVDKEGKVHGSLKLYQGSYIGEPRWEDDCKGVLIGGPNGMEELKVSY